MPVIVKRRPVSNAPDYKAACNQTVTLYNVYRDGNDTRYHKTVFEQSAFLEMQRLWRERTIGTTADTSFLLVIPQGASGYTFVPFHAFEALPDKAGFFTLKDKDKAIQGVGPDILTSAEWVSFAPSKVDGLVVLQQVDIKMNLDGTVVHIEAGG
jgi:hypothetical protein